ncbi:hypothetical protein [Clostridium sp.]|uniref:hypothetical protein n=1 Tax=Clostridium sp. TaxID=1506 RepID=UPI00260A870A|nr:hypothetical protein [Clostridium sp.]
MIKGLRRKIIARKILLSFLLKYLSATNKLVVYISQDLDKLISIRQKGLYLKYKKRNITENFIKQVA